MNQFTIRCKAHLFFSAEVAAAAIKLFLLYEESWWLWRMFVQLVTPMEMSSRSLAAIRYTFQNYGTNISVAAGQLFYFTLGVFVRLCDISFLHLLLSHDFGSNYTPRAFK